MDSLTEHTQVVCTLVAISGLIIRFRWFVSALQNEDLKTWRPGDVLLDFGTSKEQGQIQGCMCQATSL